MLNLSVNKRVVVSALPARTVPLRSIIHDALKMLNSRPPLTTDACCDVCTNDDEAWHESEHHRGQPGNKGQFGPGGAGRRSDDPTTTKEVPKSESGGSGEHAAGPGPVALFTPEEIDGLPASAQQPVSDPKVLYDKSAQALDQLQEWLNLGKGVISKMGYKRMPTAPEDTDLTQPGGMLFIAPLKGQKRAAEKVENDYEGDWSKLTDVTRCTVAVDTMDEIESVIDKLKHNGLELASKPADRFAKPTSCGYRDMMLKVKLPNGVVGEIQVHLKSILVAKNEGHKYYEVSRDLEAKPTDTWTPTERLTWRRSQESMTKLYNDAWKHATATHDASPDGDGYEYFELDGAVFRRKGSIGPVDDVLHGDRWVPYKGDRTAPIVFGNIIDMDDDDSEPTKDADFEESEHPRDDSGKFGSGGGGASSGGGASHTVKGLPEGKVPRDIASLTKRGAYDLEATSKGRDRYEVIVTAKPVKGIKTVGEGRRLMQYDPELATTMTLNPEEPIIAREIAVAKEGLPTQLPINRDPDHMYRGMSAEEFENYQSTGKIKSASDYNMQGQEALTYWSADPSEAESYANSFAPAQYKPTFEKPAYVVIAKRVAPEGITQVKGVGTNELGVNRAIESNEVLEVWRGRVATFHAGEYSLSDRGGEFSAGGSAAPSAQVVWQKVPTPTKDSALRPQSVSQKQIHSIATGEDQTINEKVAAIKQVVTSHVGDAEFADQWIKVIGGDHLSAETESTEDVEIVAKCESTAASDRADMKESTEAAEIVPVGEPHKADLVKVSQGGVRRFALAAPPPPRLFIDVNHGSARTLHYVR